MEARNIIAQPAANLGQVAKIKRTYRKRETPDEYWARIKNELRPPKKSLRELIPQECFENTRNAMEKLERMGCKVIHNNKLLAIPYPQEKPRVYYIVPNVLLVNSFHMFDNSSGIFNVGGTRFYDMEDSTTLNQYEITQAAWISTKTLQRANFEPWDVEPIWEAEGEKGVMRKIK